MKNPIVPALVAAATMIVGLGIVGVKIREPHPTPSISPSPSITTMITEDDPRWDCKTMGNRICGTPRAYRLNTTVER